MPSPRPRPRIRFATAAALILALVLAGCTGGEATGRATPGASASGGPAGRVVAGSVLDAELRPIQGALVRETEGLRNASTDATGAFRMDGLPAAARLRIEASHAGFQPQVLEVDVQYVPEAQLRFVLQPAVSREAYHLTNLTRGEIACQVAVGSHHGFPGYYKWSCEDAGAPLSLSKERVRVPVLAGIDSAVIEVKWEPQSQAADVFGLIVYLSTEAEEFILGGIHSLPGDHYMALYTGTTPMAPARPKGGIIDSLVHVDPGTLDEHIPNAGVVIQQPFELYTTAFYGAPAPPTWSVFKNG